MTGPRPGARGIIALPTDLVTTLMTVTDAIGPVVLVGGWAVRCRIRMAGGLGRPTEDLDVMVGRTALAADAHAVLAAVGARQDDPRHSARLQGLALDVDLLTAGEADDAPGTTVVQAGGLRLLIPPAGSLLARDPDPITTTDGSTSAEVLLPRAGALFVAKVGNLALEHRTRPKLMTDAADVVSLLMAFGSGAITEDLHPLLPAERTALLATLGSVGASGLATLARSQLNLDEARLTRTVAQIETLLAD